MTDGPTPHCRRRPPDGGRRLSARAAGLLVALGGALAWVAWLSWPTSGADYRPAQVVACALTCAAIADLIRRHARR